MGADERIEWNEGLLTGVEEMDRQHRILIDTLRELEGKRGSRSAALRFDEVTRDLLAYAIYHFETEEQLMKRYGYDRAEPAEAEAHLRQHREFSKYVVDLRASIRGGEPESQDTLVAFLRQWWKNHICTTDQQLGRFIQSKRATAHLH